MRHRMATPRPASRRTQRTSPSDQLDLLDRETSGRHGRLVNQATVNSRNAPSRRTRATTIIAPPPVVTG
jgi:hypothetical protein